MLGSGMALCVAKGGWINCSDQEKSTVGKHDIVCREPVGILVLLCGLEAVGCTGGREKESSVWREWPVVEAPLTTEPEHAIRRCSHCVISKKSFAREIAEHVGIDGRSEESGCRKVAVLRKGEVSSCRIVRRVFIPVPTEPLPRRRRLLCPEARERG